MMDKRSFYGLLFLLVGALAAPAAVSLDFSHSYVGPESVTQEVGYITLSFAVDGSGNVTLDASCSDPDPATYVDEFDGPVGTVSLTSLWNRAFSIYLSGGPKIALTSGD
ncbi:MAG: hypothetical protein AAF492_31660 [Verrucomicrobiota bacterium]